MHRTWLRRIGLVAAGLAVALAGLIAWQWMAPQHWALRLMLVRLEMHHWRMEWDFLGTHLSPGRVVTDFGWTMSCFQWVQRGGIADQILLAQDLLEDRREQFREIASMLLHEPLLCSHPSPAFKATLLAHAGGTDWAANCAWSHLYKRSPDDRPRLCELLLNSQLPLSSIQSRLPVFDPNDKDDLRALVTLASRCDSAVRPHILFHIGGMAKPETLDLDAVQALFRAEYQVSIHRTRLSANQTADERLMTTAISLRWLRLGRNELVALVKDDGPYGWDALTALIDTCDAERMAIIPRLVRDSSLPLFCRWRAALAAGDPHALASDLATLADDTLARPADQRLPPLDWLRRGLAERSMGIGLSDLSFRNPQALLEALGPATCARLGLPAPSSTSAAAAP